MSLLIRIKNALAPNRLHAEIDEELQSHIDEAVANGRDPSEARRAFGSALRHRESSRDAKLLPWLDSLRADALFGLRQLRKNKITTAAAILSLALALGATTSAFRLIDAILFRPLPIQHPDQLYDLSRQGIGPAGKPETFDGWAYPAFQLMRVAANKNQSELIAVSYAESIDLTYASDQDMETARLQYVSGWMFPGFGLQPATGRLFTESDDLKPHAHPYAVLSYDYWTRRFGRNPQTIDRTFRIGNDLYAIVGVAQQNFTGTEPGTMIDIFLPTMMNPAVVRSDSTWHRTLALVPPGVPLEPLRAQLDSITRAFERERAKGFVGMSQQSIDNFINQNLLMEPASSGVSDLQLETRRPLAILGVLVALVLLIACANVANLMTAQAAARSREMALRTSLGGGRRRLVQLLIVQSAWLAIAAAVIGSLFAWWSGPFVVSMINPPDNPARILLPADPRVFAFGTLLVLTVTFLCGLAPALRASAVNPVTALKGGEDPHARGRLMHILVAAQVAFCFLVLFVANLFVATFDRLSHRNIGFSADRVLAIDTVSKNRQPIAFWNQVAQSLQSLPGVESVSITDQPLLGGYNWNNFVSINGAPSNGILAFFRRETPGWIDTLRVTLREGRDFRPADTFPGTAIVNQAFAKQFMNGENPVGKTFETAEDDGARNPFQIVGVVEDTCYSNIRECVLPTAFVPFQSVSKDGTMRGRDSGVFLVRTKNANPLILADTLRRAIPNARPEFRVSRIRTQQAINDSQTVRERLLATLAKFFAAVALSLAAVGLYGVLHYSVLQRRREIGIRIAVGAKPTTIATVVTRNIFTMVATGAAAGLILGQLSTHYIESLFFEVKSTDPTIVALPAAIILAAALLAATPPTIRATKIDPATLLRTD
jgi:putative ABC transport system permease protein